MSNAFKHWIALIAGIILLGWVMEPARAQELKKASKDAVSNTLKDGDIIFQSSDYGQSKAVQLATHSPYSHCGIIFRYNDKPFVYEAVQPVKITPLDKWISHGAGGHYWVKRLKNADKVITPDVVRRMKQKADEFKDKNYDLYFGWSDDRIYCSELVWKVYKNATGLEVGKLQHLKDFDLSNPLVKKYIQERYGNHIPEDELVISPAAIYDSDLLKTVVER